MEKNQSSKLRGSLSREEIGYPLYSLSRGEREIG
jgi:hypothetical protein